MDDDDLVSRWPDEPLIVVFFVTLEQPLALPDGNTYRFLRDEPAEWLRWTAGKNFVGLRIHHAVETVNVSDIRDQVAFDIANRVMERNRNDQAEENADSKVPIPQTQLLLTVVEAATVLIPDVDADIEYSVSAAFDRCLHELRRLMIAYAKVTNDARFRPITRQTTRMIVPLAYMTADDTYLHLSMFYANTGTATLAFNPEELSPKQIHDINVSLMRDTQGDPIGRFAERNRAALRSYAIDGDYSSAIVLTYTACEVLLNGALLLMAWEEGTTRDETRGWFEGQQGFISRILNRMPPRMGGNWSTQPADAPVSLLKRLADLRHQVVHYAYAPSEHEAQDALATTKVIEDFLKLRLAQRRNTYPRTALLVLGNPGLLRHGVPQRWIDEFMAKTGSHEPSWVETYRNWLELPS